MLWWLWPGLSYGTIDRSGFPVAAISADSLGIGKLPGGWMMMMMMMKKKKKKKMKKKKKKNEI